MDSPAISDIQMQMSPSMGEQSQSEDDPKKCFSIIQTKKFWAPLLNPTCKLCPSMDLVVLGMQTPSEPASASSLWLHRTVSWQRLSTLTNFDAKDSEEGVTHFAWSPDGRKFAVAMTTGDVVLYQVEVMVSSPSSMPGEAGSQGLLCVMPVAEEGIVGLTWMHVGRNHPSWHLSDAEQEEEVSWRCVQDYMLSVFLSFQARLILSFFEIDIELLLARHWIFRSQLHEIGCLILTFLKIIWICSYRSRYLDLSAELLPPSEHFNNHHHHHDHHRAEGSHTTSSAIPTCKTPLSLLCVSTKGKGLHVYLHGRYRVLTLPMIAQRNVDVVCSSDIRNLLVHQEKSMNLSLFSIPSLSKYRYHLQTISSLYCSMTSHLEALREHAPEILASWKVSIKPLDTKLDSLVRLLSDYGVERDARSVLVQYILVGHTSVSSDMSNAIDQWLTGIQMNEQILVRMERSLQSAVANVETTARSFLLGPARALTFHASELLGLARYAPFLLSEEAAQKTLDSCAILLTTVEYAVTQLVEGRFRLRDFVAWLRSTGSETKARGTAINSAQRENAKKRRVPQALVERVLKYLQTETFQSSSITETMLGIPLTVSALTYPFFY
jgi:hypothetical protein